MNGTIGHHASKEFNFDTEIAIAQPPIEIQLVMELNMRRKLVKMALMAKHK